MSMWLIRFIVGNLRKLNDEILFLKKYLEFSLKKHTFAAN